MALQVRQAAHLRGALQRAAALLRPPQRLLHLGKHTRTDTVQIAGQDVFCYSANTNLQTHHKTSTTLAFIPRL